MTSPLARPDRAVVLAAGLGTRLRWLTADRPKALMPVAGVPAIVHTLRHLVAFGIRHVAINLHHHGDQIVRLLGDGRGFGLAIRYSREARLLDSGGGVRRACTLLPAGDTVVVCNADVISDIELARLWRRMAEPEIRAVLGLVPNPTHHPEGDFTLADGRVGLRRDNEPTWTFAGVSLWSQAVLTRYPVGAPFSLLEPMRALIAEGALGGVVHRGRWRDIGRPRDLLTIRRCQVPPR